MSRKATDSPAFTVNSTVVVLSPLERGTSACSQAASGPATAAMSCPRCRIQGVMWP
ncbi:hypothetical protein AB0J27_11350 [Micromonospora chokoriensis]